LAFTEPNITRFLSTASVASAEAGPDPVVDGEPMPVRQTMPPGDDFVAAPHFYAHDRLIVEAVGVHDQIAPDLVELIAPKLGVGLYSEGLKRKDVHHRVIIAGIQ
jgi:hypothetical protein